MGTKNDNNPNENNPNENNPNNNNPNENNPNENNPNENNPNENNQTDNNQTVNNPNENNPNENNPNNNNPNENNPNEINSNENNPNENNPNENNPNENNPNENSPNENNPNGDNPNDNLPNHFPILVWAIRDFFLKFNVSGKEDPTSDDYMEHCLQKDECKVIRDHFRERKCFAFPFPVSKMERMKDLATLDDNELANGFLGETKKLLKYIEEEAKPKEIHGKSINGTSFSELLKSLTTSIQAKHINIKSTCDYVEKETNNSAFKIAIQNFQTMFKDEVPTYPGK